MPKPCGRCTRGIPGTVTEIHKWSQSRLYRPQIYAKYCSEPIYSRFPRRGHGHQEAELHLGLIEGFYGPVWSHAEREAVAGFLAAHGYRFWHHAPKADPGNKWDQNELLASLRWRVSSDPTAIFLRR